MKDKLETKCCDKPYQGNYVTSLIGDDGKMYDVYKCLNCGHPGIYIEMRKKK